MNPTREEALLALTLEQPAEQRPAFLERLCGGDAVLRGRLEARLAAHQNAATVPDPGSHASDSVPTVRLDFPDMVSAAPGPGTHIGRYKLLEKVGEGGCGVVYVAEQTEPVHRRVALKVIKLGMDTKAVVARFEAERQALAMMDHPNIAKVLDAGATEQGRPFFVMELVRGIPITNYCDQHSLGTKERLELFIRVCQAIQHAHQKGIIHRDIKPSNILVAVSDEKPVPKVIDFGIAKATAGRLTEATVYTELQQFIGTPIYMSPEQAEMTSLDIDTRSDIYSLGVLLYELLTGSTPFDSKTLLASGLDAMRKMIREQEPPRPSTKLSALKPEQLTTTARRRSVEPPKLIQQLSGDLDWIVMKCLEKDRTRRYETANGLAADIQRHLADEPVVARPPSAAYRFEKAWRRNRLAFAAGIAVAAALIVGIAVSYWQMLAAQRAQNNEAAQRAKAEAAEKLAGASAQRARSSLYESLLGQARATRIARQIGFREEVFALVRQARDLDTPLKNLRDLRREAVASMGDFVGFRPRQISTNAHSSMRISPDGRWLALGDVHGGIEIRELPAGREVGRWQTMSHVTELVFGSASDQLLSVQPGQMAEFALDLTGRWQRTGGRPLANAFAAAAVSNEMRVLSVSGRPASRIDVIECGSGKTIHTISRPEGSRVYGGALAPNGRWLALIGNADTKQAEPLIEIWDLPRRQVHLRLSSGVSRDESLRFSEDGRYLLCLGSKGTQVYETTGFSLIDEFSGYAGMVNFGSFLPGTPWLVAPRQQQNRCLIRDHQKHETVAVIQEESPIIEAAFAPNGQFLLTRNEAGVNLYPFAGADECLTLAGHPASVTGIAFSPDGSRLVSVGKDRSVNLWDAGSGQRVWGGDRQLPGLGQAVCFSPDGSLLATGDYETPLIDLWDAGSGRHLRQLSDTTEGATWSLRFATDPERGLLLVRAANVAAPSDPIRVWQIGSTRSGLPPEDRIIARIRLPSPGDALGLETTANGQQIAFMQGAWRPFAKVLLQDTLGMTPPLKLEPLTPAWSVQSLAFTPDGGSVAALAADSRVAVFAAETGKLIRSFPLLGDSTRDRLMALSLVNGLLAVSSASNRGVEIYDFATGELRYGLPERDGTVYWVAWHPNEARLAVARDNGDIAIWDLNRVERQLTALGLGFGAESQGAGTAKGQP